MVWWNSYLSLYFTAISFIITMNTNWVTLFSIVYGVPTVTGTVLVLNTVSPLETVEADMNDKSE